ncbi:MaoC/PaaZ C-terminal domain-containing protein [Bradyrhizobium elkanii]|uniref:MaoC/PaaZ C-terminal domain-containing protein n=1 Tax=Bradyrhizobium elkanii TaxID=29448 RepID=UPI001BAD24B7|nr:MaoC/PaaZ C-terminal domain-containing protein [Bradyrhizobium elkanii]MBR1165070.1 3-alpha,7-alpha,12-alpha-trihydroxy-5-beta-cholest-24-enoyl-CoA hydratase [Bradyrhizobium elkanii]
MPLDYEKAMSLAILGQRVSYSDRELMLYAYAVGMGADPMDEKELQFVNEDAYPARALKVLPTFATVLSYGTTGMGRLDYNRAMEVDGERDLMIHRPFPLPAEVSGLFCAGDRRPSVDLRVDSSVIGVEDKGKDKGAVIRVKTVFKSGGEPLATLLSSYFCRGDGGFGGATESRAKPHPIPSRAPDKTIDISIRPDQALVFRLCGDRNPTHADPGYARLAGFPRPILHGLCTYGISCRGVLQTYADFDVNAIKRHAARFSAPVYPGETVTLDLWKDADVISFEARAKARNVTVLKHGMTVLG